MKIPEFIPGKKPTTYRGPFFLTRYILGGSMGLSTIIVPKKTKEAGEIPLSMDRKRETEQLCQNNFLPGTSNNQFFMVVSIG